MMETPVHFNDLTPAEAERLAFLAEECGEVIQAIGKILRHGYESRHPEGPKEGETNRQRLETEIADVEHGIAMLNDCCDISRLNITNAAIRRAQSRPAAYFHHQ